MVMPRGGGEPPPRKLGSSSQSISTASINKQGPSLSSGDTIRRSRDIKPPEVRRSIAGHSSAPVRSVERSGVSGRHHATLSSSPQHRVYSSQRQSGHHQQRRSPPPPGGGFTPPSQQRSRGSPAESQRFSSRRRSRSHSPSQHKSAASIDLTKVKRTVINSAPVVQRNKSRSPERFEAPKLSCSYSDGRREGISLATATRSFTGSDVFRGPEAPIQITLEELKKLRVGIKRQVQDRPQRSEHLDVRLYRRPDEGQVPMFERPEIKMAIEHRIQSEGTKGGLTNLVDSFDTLADVTAQLPPISQSTAEQRMVTVIRETLPVPIFVRATPADARVIYRDHDRYYDESERGEKRGESRERDRRGDSRERRADSRDRDRHYSSRYYRDSPPRHYDSRRSDDLRLDLDLRRRESDRSRGGRSRSRERERDREREYYAHRRHSDSYREYRDRERERERAREREMRERDRRHHRDEHERRHSPRDHRDGHRSYPPRSEGYPPRPSGGDFLGPPPPNKPPSQTPNTSSGPPSVPPRPVNFDPEYVPRGRAYFEHDNRDTFVPMGRGRGGFQLGFPRGGFIPPRGAFMGPMRGRGGFRPPGPMGPPGPRFFPGGPPPPPFFGPRGPRGGFNRTKRRSPDWQHDLFEANNQDQQPSSTTK